MDTIDPIRHRAMLRQLPSRIDLIDHIERLSRSYYLSPQDHWEASDASGVACQYHVLADETRDALMDLGVRVSVLPNADDLRRGLELLSLELVES